MIVSLLVPVIHKYLYKTKKKNRLRSRINKTSIFFFGKKERNKIDVENTNIENHHNFFLKNKTLGYSKIMDSKKFMGELSSCMKYTFIFTDAQGIMIIIIQNGLSDPISNLEQYRLHFSSC